MSKQKSHANTKVLGRRALLHAALGGLGSAAFIGNSHAENAARGITGQRAPELEVPYWIDGQGKEVSPFKVAEHRGKWVYLKCFQDWCPSCHSVGFPNLQKLKKSFPGDDKVVAAVIQTTFEGHSHNTVDALRKNQLRYELDLPFGHDPGDENLSSDNPLHYPRTMVSYQTRGTPWVTVVDPSGRVVFSDFHINMDRLVEHLQTLT